MVATASWQDVFGLNWQKSSKSAPKHAMRTPEESDSYRTRWCFNVVSHLCLLSSCSVEVLLSFSFWDAVLLLISSLPSLASLALRPFPENMR